MDAFDFIRRIECAGFAVALTRGSLAVSPASGLNDKQREFIRSHRDELVAALRSSETLTDSEGGHDLEPANDPPITVECWTPLGHPVRVTADSPEHAEWIRQSNPRPPLTVRCTDCHHARIDGGIARCKAGVESGLPVGGADSNLKCNT